MTRPKIDEELKQLATCVEALKLAPVGRRGEMMRYLNGRFSDAPLVMLHDDDADQEQQSGWPAELGAEPEAGDES